MEDKDYMCVKSDWTMCDPNCPEVKKCWHTLAEMKEYDEANTTA